MPSILKFMNNSQCAAQKKTLKNIIATIFPEIATGSLGFQLFFTCALKCIGQV